MNMTTEELSDRVTKIVSELFTGGNGQKADRLVLTSKTRGDMGGWCEEAMVTQIMNGLINEDIRQAAEFMLKIPTIRTRYDNAGLMLAKAWLAEHPE
jgi:hypothetical protein